MHNAHDLLDTPLSAVTEKPTNARERSRMETRRRLMDAWRELFVDGPGMNTTISDIARKAEVAAGTFYLHFKDKEELTQQVALESYAKLVGEVEQVDTVAHGSGEERLRAGVGAVVSFVENHPLEFRFLYTLKRLSASEGLELAELWQRFWYDRLERELRADMAEGRVNTDIDPVVAAWGIVGMFTDVLNSWAEDMTRAPRESVIETLIKLFLSYSVDESPAQGTDDRPRHSGKGGGHRD
jgi:AcrR family transcriptional regulator